MDTEKNCSIPVNKSQKALKMLSHQSFPYNQNRRMVFHFLNNSIIVYNLVKFSFRWCYEL